MKKIHKITFFAIVAMTLLSFANIVGLKIAGLSVFIGLLFYFISNVLVKNRSKYNPLNFKIIGSVLKDKSIYFWLVLPIFMNFVCFELAKFAVPGFINHVIDRTDVFVSYHHLMLLILQLAVLALGEEIAWRAFFQKQLNKILPIAPTILLSSILFSIGHFTFGSFGVVIYDLFFVFINSIFYGIIFYKTNNAWISAISHFTANLFGIFFLLFIL